MDVTKTEGQEQDEKGDVYYDETTLKRVYYGLAKAGIVGEQADDAVNQMQNAGVLFRERGKF